MLNGLVSNQDRGGLLMNLMVVSDVGLTQFTAPRGDPMADQCMTASGNGGEGGGCARNLTVAEERG
jgi:hypothetical protein